MYIIIDGYNVLKQICKTKFVREQEQKKFLHSMQQYMNCRPNQVIVVFDAGPSLYESTELFGDVVIKYAGQYQSADDYIVSYVAKHKEKDLLVVSDDNELSRRIFVYNIEVIGVQDFYKLTRDIIHAYEERAAQLSTSIHKTTQESNPEVDAIMRKALQDMQPELKEVVAKDLRHRASQKISKKDRKLLTKRLKI